MNNLELEKALKLSVRREREVEKRKPFLALAKAELERIERAPCKKPPIPELAQRNGQVSRHIPNAIRQSVWLRDEGVCQYIDPLTKRKCLSRHEVPLDHTKPFAQGGEHTKENLRLLCGAHNRGRSEAG